MATSQTLILCMMVSGRRHDGHLSDADTLYDGEW